MHFRAGEVRMRTSSRMLASCALIYLACNAVVAEAQSVQSDPSNLSSLQGTVVSAAKATVVVKTGDGIYQLFVLDHDTVRPQAIPLQAQVKVSFVPSNDPSAPPIADAVQITAAPPPNVAALTGEVPVAAPPEDEAAPVSVCADRRRSFLSCSCSASTRSWGRSSATASMRVPSSKWDSASSPRSWRSISRGYIVFRSCHAPAAGMCTRAAARHSISPTAISRRRLTAARLISVISTLTSDSTSCLGCSPETGCSWR